jgi:curved DNA-binding protein CbpA
LARKTYYEILKVQSDASRREIKKAFRLRAAECHPDKVMHLEVELRERAERKMTLINEAYKVLSNDGARQDYDEYLEILAVKRGDPPPKRFNAESSGDEADKDAPASKPKKQEAKKSEPPPEPTPPPPEPEKPPPPPPELSGSELLGALERAIGRIQGGISETHPGIPFQVGGVPGFDLTLHGASTEHAYGLYLGSADRLDDSTLQGFIQKTEDAASRVPLQGTPLSSVVLVLFLQYADRKQLEAAVRENNQRQMATLVKRRGRTTLAGTLHIPSGTLFLPYARTIGLDLRYLSDVGSHY